MNHVFLSFLLIIAVGTFLVVSADDDCCSFPTPSMGVATNVSARNFVCNEPIYIQCAVSALNGKNRVGIAGFKDIADRRSYEIVAERDWVVSNILICNPATISWHLKGDVPEYQFFACAYRGETGSWELAN
ncbi:hypothetical protein CAEBREN_15806 [Caenorhabditis brenneri]|uniref:Uncharacterized protein n=1 Tax=Caenorhabditis brenneri TaxID=135651 RepID=G0MN29_CAEBE|nr:hypothetical protein CAEBREN_15806 [Caenorhabditis brenneri]